MLPLFLRTGLVFLILALVVPGCSDTVDPGKRLSPIEGATLFSVRETHEQPGDDPRLSLLLESERIYGCCNFTVVADIARRGRTITVELLGIDEHNVCLTAEGPATLVAPLDLEAGTYDLEFARGDDRDVYRVTVSAASVRIEDGAGEFTRPGFELCWRYPPRSLAVRCRPDPEFDAVVDGYVELLVTELGLSEFRIPDEGRPPYLGYGTRPARLFRYQSEWDFALAVAVLESYAREAICPGDPRAALYLVNWRNVEYGSWMACE